MLVMMHMSVKLPMSRVGRAMASTSAIVDNPTSRTGMPFSFSGRLFAFCECTTLKMVMPIVANNPSRQMQITISAKILSIAVT